MLCRRTSSCYGRVFKESTSGISDALKFTGDHVPKPETSRLCLSVEGKVHLPRKPITDSSVDFKGKEWDGVHPGAGRGTLNGLLR